MDVRPPQARVSGLLRGVPVDVLQRGPVVLADGVRLHEDEVPVGLGVARHREVHGGTLGRDADRVLEPLVRRVGLLGDRELRAIGRYGDRLEQVAVDRIDVLDAVGGVGLRVVAPDRQRGEVAGHRVAGVPRPRRQPVPRRLLHQVAVGQHAAALWRRDVEGVRRGVGGVVVDGIPARGDVRLADHECALVGVHEPGALEPDRHARVGDLDPELLALADRLVRPHPELVPLPTPGRPLAVDLDAVDLQPDQVEVEARQLLGGGRRDRCQAREPVRGGLVPRVEVVVADVVPAVAVLREVAVTHAGRSRGGCRPLLRIGGNRDGRRRQRQDCEGDDDRPLDQHGVTIGPISGPPLHP